MSSAPKGERRESDYYPTPDALAEFLVQKLWDDGFMCAAETTLEPSAGDGAFVRALQGTGTLIDALEPDKCGSQIKGGDVEVFQVTLEDYARRNQHGDGYGLIIGNPPYSLAQEHIEICLGMLTGYGALAFLLRLSFLESAKRVEFWKQHPASKVYVLSERPSFTEDGRSDSCAYGFFVWENVPNKKTELEVVSWKP